MPNQNLNVIDLINDITLMALNIHTHEGVDADILALAQARWDTFVAWAEEYPRN